MVLVSFVLLVSLFKPYIHFESTPLGRSFLEVGELGLDHFLAKGVDLSKKTSNNGRFSDRVLGIYIVLYTTMHKFFSYRTTSTF